MIGRFSTALVVTLALACSRQAPQPAPAAAGNVAAESQDGEGDEAGEEETHAAKSRSRATKDKQAPRAVEGEGANFSVPFVWQTSKTDPLAVTRQHLREILTDNTRYAKEHARMKAPGPGDQRPSTTLLSCSDSHIQVPALDATPENDMFVVRNMGNQLDNALPSVEYGIGELKTPLLLIVGHTDCDAVHLAVNRDPKVSKALKRELARIPVPKTKKPASGNELLKQAVLENVHMQVETAIGRFQSLVHASKLTIVGAVYDPANALRQGAGKLHIINVNSNRDPAAMSAFVKAVMSDNKIVRLDPEAPHDGEEHELADESEAEEPRSLVSSRSTPTARAPQSARKEPTQMAVATRQEAPKKKNDSMGFDLDQLEAASKETMRSKSPAVDPSIIEASLIDHN